MPVPAWEGRAVTTRPVVSAGQYGANLNQLVFTVDSDPDANPATDDAVVTAKTQAILPMSARTRTAVRPLATPPLYPVDAPTKSIVDAAFAKADVLGSVKLGQLAGPFTPRPARLGRRRTAVASPPSATWSPRCSAGPRTPRGGQRPDRLHEPRRPARRHGGQRRGRYPADLTYKQAAVVQPFANTLVNMRMTGAQIKTVLEQQWQRDGRANPVPSVPAPRHLGGLQVHLRPRPGRG